MSARTLSVGAFLAFFLNVAWENAQAYLYRGYEGFWQHLDDCTVAALGDIFLVGLVYLLLWLFTNDSQWIFTLTIPKAAGTVAAGVAIALVVEWGGLALGAWEYAAMPLIPRIGIGVTPVAQMAILPLVVFSVMYRVHRRQTQIS